MTTHRPVTAAEAGAIARANTTWVRTYNTICDPPVTLWCEGDTPKMRAIHFDGRYGTPTETVYEVIE